MILFNTQIEYFRHAGQKVGDEPEGVRVTYPPTGVQTASIENVTRRENLVLAMERMAKIVKEYYLEREQGVEMKICIGEKGSEDRTEMRVNPAHDVELSEVYNGVGIVTDLGLFGIACRDEGIEVMLDGQLVWSSSDDQTVHTICALRHAKVNRIPSQGEVVRGPDGKLYVSDGFRELEPKETDVERADRIEELDPFMVGNLNRERNLDRERSAYLNLPNEVEVDREEGRDYGSWGIRLIEEERARQILEEGFDEEHDRKHDRSELIKAAISYLYSYLGVKFCGAEYRALAKEVWPFPPHEFKPATNGQIGNMRDLERAGALVAAHMDAFPESRYKRDANQEGGKVNWIPGQGEIIRGPGGKLFASDGRLGKDGSLCATRLWAGEPCCISNWENMKGSKKGRSANHPFVESPEEKDSKV